MLFLLSFTGIMTFSWFSALSDLNESRYDWTIRVRAQAIWQGMNAQTKVFRGLNIIFIDDAVSDIVLLSNRKNRVLLLF